MFVNLDSVKPNDILCVYNKRVGEWAGSHDCPVIELLGVGGHLPIIWQQKKKILSVDV